MFKETSFEEVSLGFSSAFEVLTSSLQAENISIKINIRIDMIFAFNGFHLSYTLVVLPSTILHNIYALCKSKVIIICAYLIAFSIYVF